MQKIILDTIEEFEKNFIHKGEDGDDQAQDWNWTIKGSFPIEVEIFLKQALTNAFEAGQKSMEKEMQSKINMILLGIDTFIESEEQRDSEEQKGLVRRDGGRTMSAFCLINQIKEELKSLSLTKELK